VLPHYPMEVNNECINVTNLGDEVESDTDDDIEVVGRLSYIGDVDYYKFRAVDDNDAPIQDFSIDQRISIEFASNPNDEFRFDVYRDIDGGCEGADLMQTSTDSFYYYGYRQHCNPKAVNCVWGINDNFYSCQNVPPLRKKGSNNRGD